jgi:hypothetical protein
MTGLTKVEPMNEDRISPDRSNVGDLPFDPKPECLVDFGLCCVASDCRGAILGPDEGPRAVALGQLALDIEKLRRKHAETCPECSGEAA